MQTIQLTDTFINIVYMAGICIIYWLVYVARTCIVYCLSLTLNRCMNGDTVFDVRIFLIMYVTVRVVQ